MIILELLEKYDIFAHNFCEVIRPDTPYEDIYLTKGGDILVKLNFGSVEQWLRQLDKDVDSIKSLLKSEGVDEQDKAKALRSISETCMPKKLSEMYLRFIYQQ